MNGTVIVMLVKHITQSLNESARVKEKRRLFFQLSIELIEFNNFQLFELKNLKRRATMLLVIECMIHV